MEFLIGFRYQDFGRFDSGLVLCGSAETKTCENSLTMPMHVCRLGVVQAGGRSHFDEHICQGQQHGNDWRVGDGYKDHCAEDHSHRLHRLKHHLHACEPMPCQRCSVLCSMAQELHRTRQTTNQ